MKVLNKKKDEKMNFERVSEEWLNYKKISIKSSTYYNYLFIIERYLNPEFKGRNIESTMW